MKIPPHIRAMVGPADVRWYGVQVKDKDVVKYLGIGDPTWSPALTCWVTSRWAIQPLRDHLQAAGYTVALIDVTVLPPPSEAFMAKKRPTVTYLAAGWPDPHTRGLKLCGTQNTAPCSGLPVWQVERQHRGYVSTGYRCDDHLDPADRDVALADAAERLATTGIEELGAAA